MLYKTKEHLHETTNIFVTHEQLELPHDATLTWAGGAQSLTPGNYLHLWSLMTNTERLHLGDLRDQLVTDPS